MPGAAHLLALSADVERGLRIGAVVLLLVLVVRALRGPRLAARPALAIAPRTERLAMLAILAWVAATTLVGAGSPHEPRWYFSQVSTLHVADMLREPGLARRWLAALGNLQIIWEHESPVQAPVAAAFQRVLGPSLELPTYVAVPWALAAVALAWRFGRAVETPAFGILFAALLAVSPVEITWARLGGIYIGAATGVLLALNAGWLVGRRRGILGAFALGAVAWSTVYFYYPARVGIVLAFVALWAGARRAGRARSLLALFPAAAAGLAACVLLQHALGPGQSLWPSYPTYVGSRGETGLHDWLASIRSALQEHGTLAVRMYFWHMRMPDVVRTLGLTASGWPDVALAPGMAAGGLVLVPTLVLGVLGILRALRHPIDRLVWFAVAAGGFFPVLLGFPASRRFLVFELGWAAFAALGLAGIVESRLLDPTPPSRRGRWAAAVVVGIGAWSAATLALSWGALPSQHVHVPFGDSGFGDGTTCLGCLATARVWRAEIEAGRMVIALDTDMFRENATSPGGLMLYGKTVALQAGRPDLFVDYYAVVGNYDRWPPRPGSIAGAVPEDVARVLGERIEAAKPTAVVWWLGQPNAWERRLADVLVAAGSHVTYPPPIPLWGSTRSSVTADPIRVETAWSGRGVALVALRELVDPPAPRACVHLEKAATKTFPGWPLFVAPVREDDAGLPEWAILSWQDADVWGHPEPASWTSVFDYGREADGTRTADMLNSFGHTRSWTEAGAQISRPPPPGPRPIGRECAVLRDGRWWVVDPITGSLWVPREPALERSLGAIGIAQTDDAVLVATADQTIQVLDPATGEIVGRFPATVVPPRQFDFGECALLAVGRGWIASLDDYRGFLHLYDTAGAPLARVPVATGLLGTGPSAVHSIHGAGDFLGVGYDVTVATFRVVRDDCAVP